MAEPELPVILYGLRIGELVRTGGRALFRWSDAAERRWGINSPALSNGLRVGVASVDATEAFFGALLPEGNALDQLARQIGTSSNDLTGILERVGADLAGALNVGLVGARPEAVRVLTTDELQAAVRNARGFILGTRGGAVGGGGSAVAGIQRKLALTRVDGQWAIGNDDVASTHILKPVATEARDVVIREQYTLDLARALGLTTFASWIETIGEETVLVVERYDRLDINGAVTRLHQEDMAQALALPWGGNDKFQWANPASNLAAIAATLDRERSIFDTSPSQRERLLRYVTFNVAVGNTDAHAKNYSILRPEEGRPQLAPLYDAAPIMLSYDASQRLALYIDDQQWLPDVTMDHLANEAVRWGVTDARAREIIVDTLEQLVVATQDVVADPVISAAAPGFIRGQTKNLLAGKRAALDIAGPLGLQTRIDSATHD